MLSASLALRALLVVSYQGAHVSSLPARKDPIARPTLVLEIAYDLCLPQPASVSLPAQ